MRQRVESYGLKKEEVEGIMRKLEEGHYQIACGLHFAAVHLKELSTGSVSHPNQWYLESRGEVAGGGAGGGQDQQEREDGAGERVQSEHPARDPVPGDRG